jgi:hypothetical protein
MPGHGLIISELSIWCACCERWDTDNCEADGNKTVFARTKIKEGWKKIKGRFVCPECVAKGKKPE